MATYRYYTADLLTNAVMVEVPAYGVYMDKTLSAAGNFTGTYVLDSGIDNDVTLIAGTIPGQHALFVERDGQCIWAGPIWSRTYQSSSKTVQLTAQTFESVFEHIKMETDQVYAATEQVIILNAWLVAMMAQTNNNFGIIGSYPGFTGVTRTISMLASERRMASELLQTIIGANNGLDITINVASPGSKTMVITPTGSSVASGAYFEYPGQISTYWYSESAARGGIRAVALGNGVAAEVLAPGASTKPYFSVVEQYSDISDSALITAKANQLLVSRKMPVPSPTFQMANSQDFADAGLWDRCGQTFNVRIADPRFPAGQVFTSRMTGWSLTPEQSETDEQLSFVLESDS